MENVNELKLKKKISLLTMNIHAEGKGAFSQIWKFEALKICKR